MVKDKLNAHFVFKNKFFFTVDVIFNKLENGSIKIDSFH